MADVGILLNDNNKVSYRLSNVLMAFKEVFFRPSYIITASLVAIALFVFNIAIVNIGYYLTFPPIRLSFAVFTGTMMSMHLHSVIMLIILAILSGILTGFIAYQVRYLNSINESSALGIGGMILGILAPACATCGIGLIAILGLSGVAASLPFAGVGIGILGAILLLVGIYSISQKIAIKACRPKLRNKAGNIKKQMQ